MAIIVIFSMVLVLAGAKWTGCGVHDIHDKLLVGFFVGVEASRCFVCLMWDDILTKSSEGISCNVKVVHSMAQLYGIS